MVIYFEKMTMTIEFWRLREVRGETDGRRLVMPLRTETKKNGQKKSQHFAILENRDPNDIVFSENIHQKKKRKKKTGKTCGTSRAL